MIYGTIVQMKTKVEKLTPTKVKLTITLGTPELEAAEHVALNKLAKNVKAPGFRAGKVPLSVAKKSLDPNVLAEQTVEDAISKSVAEAFIAEEIQVLERPSVEIGKFVPEQELEFTAEAECLPAVKLGDYTKLSVKREVAKVSKEDIDSVLDRIAAGMSEKHEVTRAAKDGDEAIIDFVGKKDGVAFNGGTANDYALTLGSNSFIPGFEEAIVGHKSSDEAFDIPLEFPADYQAADLAGQKVVFTVTLKKLNEIVKPKFDDVFAAKAGPFTSMKELTDDVKRELTAQREKEADTKLKDALVEALIATSDIPTPDVLVDDQLQSIEQDMTQNLMYQGLSLEQYLQAQKFADKDEWIANEARPAATKRVQAGMALAELSKVLKIDATSDELAQHLNEYRDQYKNNPEMVKRFDDTEVQRDVANRLITEKTVDKLVELNTK